MLQYHKISTSDYIHTQITVRGVLQVCLTFSWCNISLPIPRTIFKDSKHSQLDYCSDSKHIMSLCNPFSLFIPFHEVSCPSQDPVRLTCIPSRTPSSWPYQRLSCLRTVSMDRKLDLYQDSVFEKLNYDNTSDIQ